MSQVAALADVFGVPPSWFLYREEKPVHLEEAVEALRDETAGAKLREIIQRPERERRIVLGIVRQFEQMDGTPDGL